MREITYNMFFKTSLRLLICLSFACAVLLSLTQCGFRLKQEVALTSTLPEITIIHSEVDPQFINRLEKSLKDRGINISDDANAQLHILRYTENRRAASINTVNASQIETQISKSISFSLTQKDKTLLIEPSSLSRQKEYTNDNGNIAGKAQEERLIKKELDEEIIALILRRLEGIDDATLQNHVDPGSAQGSDKSSAPTPAPNGL